jgi:hypothetical protein
VVTGLELAKLQLRPSPSAQGERTAEQDTHLGPPVAHCNGNSREQQGKRSRCVSSITSQSGNNTARGLGTTQQEVSTCLQYHEPVTTFTVTLTYARNCTYYKIQRFGNWHVTAWGSCKNRRVGGPYRLQLQGGKNQRTTNSVSNYKSHTASHPCRRHSS